MYRKATLNDCERIYSLICDLEETKFPYEKFYEIYCEQLNSRHYYCLVHVQNNIINAVLNLRFEKQLHHCECIAEIMEFVVDSSCRKQGIGNEMFEKASQIAKTHGCSQIEVACNQSRTSTHRFYLREGMNNSHYKFFKSFI